MENSLDSLVDHVKPVKTEKYEFENGDLSTVTALLEFSYSRDSDHRHETKKFQVEYFSKSKKLQIRTLNQKRKQWF